MIKCAELLPSVPIVMIQPKDEADSMVTRSRGHNLDPSLRSSFSGEFSVATGTPMRLWHFERGGLAQCVAPEAGACRPRLPG
jgi:hypothetical protein